MKTSNTNTVFKIQNAFKTDSVQKSVDFLKRLPNLLTVRSTFVNIELGFLIITFDNFHISHLYECLYEDQWKANDFVVLKWILENEWNKKWHLFSYFWASAWSLGLTAIDLLLFLFYGLQGLNWLNTNIQCGASGLNLFKFVTIVCNSVIPLK